MSGEGGATAGSLAALMAEAEATYERQAPAVRVIAVVVRDKSQAEIARWFLRGGPGHEFVVLRPGYGAMPMGMRFSAVYVVRGFELQGDRRTRRMALQWMDHVRMRMLPDALEYTVRNVAEVPDVY